MGRRKKGRAISGWLILDKPAGITSTAVVNKVRWALDAKKAGHAGTLDPEATGVLAIALGEATKTVPYITDALKAYRFDMVMGVATKTDDAEGEVIATSPTRPDEATIRAALPAFTGDIEQVPPQFSAVKVDGERAYARARGGEEMELAARPLYVESLDLIGVEGDIATLEMVCGKGGYVRSIARDLGEALGCLGHVKQLRRIWSGPFEPSDGITMDELDTLARTPELDTKIHPLQVGLQDLTEVMATPEGAVRLRNGNPGMVIATGVEYGEEVWASHQGEPVAVGVYKAGELHPSRVFNLESADASGGDI